ncbi:MAG: nucleotide exchange factor GrpE [Candidatus Sumerlaeaceae bacterium]|nr:nucleotide exchange factor GrpE [Candidatus Sumerlaeaceae bacterium]
MRSALNRARYRLQRLRRSGKEVVIVREPQPLPTADSAQSPAEPGTAEIARLQDLIRSQTDEITALRQALDRLKAEAEDTILRQRAEFDNYRKRTLKEKEQARSAATEDLVAKLLPVLDNFDRALHSTKTATDAGAIRQGVEMVAEQLRRLLEAEGVQEIPALHQPFDPEKHEAVSVEHTTEVPDNHVSGVMLAGYEMNGRVIRPAMVTVARDPGK